MITLVGLPQCSTCKNIEKLLKQHNLEYVYRDITQDVPTASELEAWFSRSGETSFKKIVNTSGIKYRELNLKEVLATQSLSEQFATIAQDGMLIKRPIIVMDSGEVYWGAKATEYAQSLEKGE